MKQLLVVLAACVGAALGRKLAKVQGTMFPKCSGLILASDKRRATFDLKCVHFDRKKYKNVLPKKAQRIEVISFFSLV